MFASLRKSFSTIPVARKLREVAKISLFERENVDTIKEIWAKFHATKSHIVANVRADSQ